MTDPNARPRPKLSTEGQVFVTFAAAQTYAAQMRMGDKIEEARRDLTEVMLDAHRLEAVVDGRACKCRARIKRRGIDLTAQVVVEGRLIVVVSVNVRDLNQ